MIIPNQSNIAFQYALPECQTEHADEDSNTVTTEILTYSISKIKSTDKVVMLEGETSRHTIMIRNNSQTTLFNMVLKDVMSAGATYVAGSVAVNGISQPAYDPVAGIPLPDLQPDQSVLIAYTIRANNPMTHSLVTDYATLYFTVDDPIRGDVNFSENTNTASVQIMSNRATIVKSVDKAYAAQGDTLHYTSVITNSGTTEKTDLFFTDHIPEGTTFTAGSVKINGAAHPAYNPQTGFSLPDLDTGDEVTVEFDVTVD